MSIVNDIKKEAQKNRTVIQSSDGMKLSGILNRSFYAEKNLDKEVDFVKQLMTRGLESTERVGLHASAMLTGEKDFCLRMQVLSLIYKQLQGEQISVNLLRIFEEGNAIHEKWQRLFIRAGWSEPDELDHTQFCKKYKMSFTPDIICTIPEFYDGKMIGEIKSVNTYQFQKMTHHPSAWKQCQWYMHLTGIHKGFCLSEDKNTQDIKVEVYDYDPDKVDPFVDRAESIMYYYNRVFKEHKMPKRPDDAKTPDCKRCAQCNMRDACWNIGIGRVRL